MKNLRIRLVVLLLLSTVLFAAGNARAVTESGYIAGEGALESQSFRVEAGTDPLVEVSFSYPRGSVDFWVSVMSADLIEIGNYDLDDNPVVKLEGGGTFQLTIYSKSGVGHWSAQYYIDSNGGCPKWPDQKNRYLTSADLSECTCWELRVLRNEIYARHGRKFKSQDLQDYFSAQPWYSIDPNNLNGDKGQNEYEKKNARIILLEEKGRGCR